MYILWQLGKKVSSCVRGGGHFAYCLCLRFFFWFWFSLISHFFVLIFLPLLLSFSLFPSFSTSLWLNNFLVLVPYLWKGYLSSSINTYLVNNNCNNQTGNSTMYFYQKVTQQKVRSILICLRHLFRSGAVSYLTLFFSKDLFLFIRA